MAIAEEADDLKLAVQIMAGLLASGRYTELANITVALSMMR